MGEVKKISDAFSAGGQPTPEQIKQLAEQGYKAVVNLRSQDEVGVLADEQQQAEAVGLEYVNVQLNPGVADADLTAKVLTELEELPTPIYFHCGAGARASALALIALATQQKLNREEVLAKAEALGINLEQPHLKQFLEDL
uniref:Beta-lactamase hydrolase-like protein phosphatase-like domain-containing protein n=1 Tax=Cyanothece sp. (strain PCC 7425 / ATCC 29141) TaxID=395961 RepID=B8HKW7_CYAP4